VTDAIEDMKHVLWPQAFRHDMPGDMLRLESALQKPYPLERPRAYFSGEHLGAPHGWMQAAIQSGRAAARAILAQR
jgi:monoamine oxidase